MKYARYALITLYISLLPSVVLAVGSNFPDSYFAKDNPQLTPQERTSIEIAKKWQQSSATGIKPVAGPDGTIRFLFGAQQPSIVCAVLQVCDIQLQPGEQVNSIHLGDQVPVSYTHLRAHETVLDLVCRLLLEKKKQSNNITCTHINLNSVQW